MSARIQIKQLYRNRQDECDDRARAARKEARALNAVAKTLVEAGELWMKAANADDPQGAHAFALTAMATEARASAIASEAERADDSN